MKKSLLPAFAVMLGAMSAQAESVTVHYWTVNQYLAPDYEIFKPTEHELQRNEDGSFTLKNFQNSSMDLRFTITDEKYDTKTYKFDGNAKDNSFVVDFGSQFDSDCYAPNPVGGNYKYNLTTPDDWSYYVGLGYGSVKIPVQNVSEDMQLYKVLSSGTKFNLASLKGETDDAKIYKIWIRNRYNFKLTEPVTAEAGGNQTKQITDISYTYGGFVIFEVSVPKEKSSVKYVDADNNELFKETSSVIEQKSVDNIVVSNFENSGKSVSFYITGKPFAEGKSTLFFASGFDSENNADSYQALEGATYSLVGADNVAVTGPVMVKPSGCYAEVVEEVNYQTSSYKIYLDTKIGDVTGYAVLDPVMNGVAVATGEMYDIKYKHGSTFETATDFGEAKAQIRRVDDNTIVVYDYLGSGVPVPFVAGEMMTDVPENSAYYAYQLLTVAPECWNGNTSSGKIKVTYDESAKFTARVIDPATGITDVPGEFVNPTFYAGKNYCFIRYYKEDGKIRKEYAHLWGGVAPHTAMWHFATWNEYIEDSGIEDIEADGADAPAEWFNLQGVRMNGDNLAPGVYIKRQGAKATKVLVK